MRLTEYMYLLNTKRLPDKRESRFRLSHVDLEHDRELVKDLRKCVARTD